MATKKLYNMKLCGLNITIIKRNISKYFLVCYKVFCIEYKGTWTNITIEANNVWINISVKNQIAMIRLFTNKLVHILSYSEVGSNVFANVSVCIFQRLPPSIFYKL